MKNQHYPNHCGSCWAHGTVASVESAIKIATGKTVHISEQQLISCEPNYGSCNGGNFADGFYLSKGANYLEDFPYEAANVACKEDAPQHEMLESWAYVGDRKMGPTVDDIKRAIYKYGPVAATVSASGSWDAYKSGIYNDCNYGMLNHIVAIVGWNDDDQAWIVKNSHGVEWGDQGYIRIRYTDQYGRKCNRIGDAATIAIAKK